MRAIDAADALFEATLTCDSWGEVIDAMPKQKDGRFAVTVYFDTEEEAAAFKNAVAAVTVSS